MANEIIKQFLDSRNEELLSVQEMKNGTDSKVFLVNEKYIFKFHNPNTIKAEFEYFNSYPCDINEKIVFVSKDYSYIVYEFIENDGTLENIESLILKIKDYVDVYPVFDGDKFGFLFEETNTWLECLKNELEDKKVHSLKVLNESDYQKALHALEMLGNYTFTKKLMHGDFGLHNLLFLNHRLIGIIDPQPLIGDPLYDFIFCILSDEDIAKPEIIMNLHAFAPNEPKEKIDAMIVFVLFCRIARCVKYHLAELDHFKKLWQTLAIDNSQNHPII